jgi:IS5 family transposase
LHKPFTACIAKGKAGKPYEFGNKVGLITTAKTGIILAIKAFEGNPHDSKTIEPLLLQVQQQQRWLPQELIYDRGGKGASQILGVHITTPNKPKKTDSEYTKRKNRAKFRMRAGIEPIIGHLKTDFRMAQNYLHGTDSAQMNAYLAASAWNLKKLMKELRRNFVRFISKLFFTMFYPSIRELKLG